MRSDYKKCAHIGASSCAGCFPLLLCAYVSVRHPHPQIGTAITFLQNAGVKRNPLNQKQQFLRSKGLTEDEIQIACERAGVFGGSGADPTTVINMGIGTAAAAAAASDQRLHHHLHGIPLRSPAAKSLLQHVRDVLSASALVAGVAYAVYMFYKVGRPTEPRCGRWWRDRWWWLLYR